MRNQVTLDCARRPALRLPAASRRWLTAGVVAAVVALSAACARADSKPPVRPIEPQAAECLRDFATLSLPVMSTPTERMVLRKDGAWLRVFVSERSNWIIACQGGPEGMTDQFGTLMQPGDGLTFHGGYDSVLKAHLLLGRLPAGSALVEARLADGQVVAGDHNGTIFVIWAPGGLQVENAQVTVYATDRTVLATAAAPTG